MKSEFIIVKTNTQEYKVFFQDGFYSLTNPIKRLHKHNYAEVHVIANGNAVFCVGDSLYTLTSGSMMIIPRGVFHYCYSKDENTFHTAFQIDYEAEKITMYSVGADVILNFCAEIEKCKKSGDYANITAYIVLFCNYFCHKKKVIAQTVDDYGFTIQEFFSIHYSEDIHLGDLANLLHLSERQTERLVKEYTGNSFRNELAAIRINIAKNLLKYSQMSMREICEYVGYKSYAGFWKAMKKYKE